jgi:hypothetical protein
MCVTPSDASLPTVAPVGMAPIAMRSSPTQDSQVVRGSGPNHRELYR